MALISLSGITVKFGGPALLDGVDFHLEAGDRVCLVGRNGEGKSTLLRLLNGEIEPDEGKITVAAGVTTAYLPQTVPQNMTGTIREIISGNRHKSEEIDRVLSFVKLDAAATFESLSGGLKRRVLLAKALIASPQVLLLDEPTNHLDIKSILWLEGVLKRYPGTIFFVTHDRMFLRRLATRIVDLDRGQLNAWNCDYDTFLRHKEELLNDEAVHQRRQDRKLSKEESWIRQGIKARRTRNEGRVRALEKMRRQRQARRNTVGIANIQLQQADLSGRLVINAKNVSFGYEADQPIVKNLSIRIMRGDKIGIIGPNGCGKTTLLRLLLGPYAATEEEKLSARKQSILDHRVLALAVAPEDTPGLTADSGTIEQGTRLEVAYFDQHRNVLNEDRSVFENIAGGRDTVVLNGQPRNVFGYLQDFLFSADRARTPVRILSGGERNRLLLAKLFAQPANLLVMDEPTNDLDAETLALLEEKLVEYTGTLMLVSHDREFLNNVASSTLVFESPGIVREYIGGYDDWLRQRPNPKVKDMSREKTPSSQGREPRQKRKKRSYKQNRELQELPAVIEVLEAEQSRLHDLLAAPSTYRDGETDVASLIEKERKLSEELVAAYARWEELEDIE